MSFRGYAIRLHLPVVSLGRLRLPPGRQRVKYGWVRFAWTQDRKSIIVTLEDREGQTARFQDVTQVRYISRLVGVGACYALMKYNRYQHGEHPGDGGKIIIATNGIDPVQTFQGLAAA